MRWTVAPPPRKGDRRVSRPFAVWPTTMSDGQTVVWLERYSIEERFVGGRGNPGHWAVEKRFAD